MISGQPSYRLELLIRPNWVAILKAVFKDQLNIDTPPWFDDEVESGFDARLNRISSGKENLENEELKNFLKTKRLGGLESLCAFRFVEFYHHGSRLTQTWSDYEGTFIDGISAQWKPFPLLSFSPNWIGLVEPQYKVPLPDKMLAQMPYSCAVRGIHEFFTEMAEIYDGEAMCAIKKFPDWLEQEFGEKEVRYELKSSFRGTISSLEEHQPANQNRKKWGKDNGVVLYKQPVDAHVFKNRFYALELKWHFPASS